ncbi:hypothetical protein [Komagataeibacter europaeus]|uniref:hypothetical protein n=1 Tax=Komagataeibacter europaeus TaxID=33995 RepID=UPI000237EF7F|nr:hypothetical protein [Komagataeibacter europaeus]
MDRQIVYPAQIPLDSDQLNAQRNAYVGLGQLAAMAYGWSTVAASGFACVPGTGLALVIAPGSLLAPGVVDASAYGTLAAISSALVRQYASRDPVALAVLGAGATYTVYVTPATVDTDDTVLPFYNAADPSVTYAGADNSGKTAPTVRQDMAQIGIGASMPDGAYPLWTITVPAGATSITADMIAQAAGAPFYDTIPQLQAAKQDALGFTPVQQGGGPGQTTDKINLGQDATYSGLLRIAIDGVDKGTLLSGTYLATITGTTGDLPGMGLWFQNATQRPAFTYQDATGAPKIIDLPNQADVQQVQTNLTAATANQANVNATLSADISDCVSGVYGKAAGDYQIQGLYQQESTGRPIAVYNNGTAYVFEGIAITTDITTVQSNLTAFQTSQANTNGTFASEIAARVPTNAVNDGVNAPITLFNYYLGNGTPWASAGGVSFNLVKSSPASGWNYSVNITSGNNGGLYVTDSTGTQNVYYPASSQNVSGSYKTYVVDGMRFLSFKIMASDGQKIAFPIAFSEAPYVAVSSSETRDGKGNSVTANVYYGTTTQSQFSVHLAQYGAAIPSTAPVEVTVMAMGAA